MDLKFRDSSVFTGQLLNYEDALNISVHRNDSQSEIYLIVITLSDSETKSTKIFLAINVNSPQRQDLIAYHLPQIKSTNIMNMTIRMYKQTQIIIAEDPKTIIKYSVSEMVRQFNLELIDVKYIRIRGPTLRGGATKPQYFKPGSTLTDQQERWCRCVLHVGKQSSARNPYAICSKSVGTSVRTCSQNYQWENIPEDELQGYADRHGIDTTKSSTKSDIIETIQSWKQNEGKS